MPSLIIHLAIAKRYSELHPNNISNPKEFQKGSIAPDLNSDFSRLLTKPEKAVTHYYSEPNEFQTDFNLFRQDQKVNLTDDYWKGYYAHLLADYLFYTHYFEKEVSQSINDGTNLYDDFSILTSKIIEDYHLKLDDDYITDAVKQYLIAKDGECKYLNYTKVHDFIEKMSMTNKHY